MEGFNSQSVSLVLGWQMLLPVDRAGQAVSPFVDSLYAKLS